MHVELVTTHSGDGKELDGVLCLPPEEKRRKRGIFLAHGLTWNFYRGPVRHLAPLFAAAGYPCLALNARDHDMKDPVEFDASHHDLRAGLDFLRARGIEENVLLTHGYACNKAVLFSRQSGLDAAMTYVLTTLGSVQSYRPDIWADVLAGAPQMRGRALVVQGAIDPLIEAKKRADELVAAATNCRVDVVMLEKGDHYFKDACGELAEVILEWLEKN